MRVVGSFSCARRRASRAAISPLSRSWSYPARCSMPCMTRIFSSSRLRWPYRRAFSLAMSTEMAISPPSGPAKASTSVGLFLRRKRRFSSCTRRLPVTSTSMCPCTPTSDWALRTKRLSSVTPAPSIFFSKMTIWCQNKSGGPCCPPALNSTKLLLLQRRFRRPLLFLHLARQLQRHVLAARPFIVGTHDALHKMMPHHVLLGEEVEENSLDRLEHLHRLQQAALARVGQVNLGNVAGDHHLGVEAHAGHEHLHLLGRRVLRLVQDDERIVQGAPAHEGDGRDLNHVALQVAVHSLLVHQVVERVIEWAEIGVDLLLQRSGQKAQALTGLDRRPCQDDPVHPLGIQRRDGHRHGEVGLARARGPDAEDHVVLFNSIDIASLVHALRLDLTFAERALLSCLGQAAQSGGLV